MAAIARQRHPCHDAVDECRFTVLIASSAARWDRLTQLAARLAQHATVEHATAEHPTPRFVVIARDFASGSDAERWQLPLAQRAMVGLDCTDEERTEEALARLRRVLKLEDPVEEPPTCPYPGLERFTAANRHLLFGRDGDREAILQRIRARYTRILVLGPSGSGKSSLVHAAVLPALRPNDHLVQIVPRGGTSPPRYALRSTCSRSRAQAPHSISIWPPFRRPAMPRSSKRALDCVPRSHRTHAGLSWSSIHSRRSSPAMTPPRV
jgi:hypothetical protein